MRKRQLVKPALWFLVVIVVGVVDSLRGGVRLVARLKPAGVFALLILAVLWRSSDLLAAQLPLDRVLPPGIRTEVLGTLALGVLVVWRGVRSRLRRGLWARLAARLRLGR